MPTLRHGLIGAGLAAFRTTGLHRALAPWTRGRGAILALHRVRPLAPGAFAPNRGLEITPDHLDAVLRHLAGLGYEVVPLAAVGSRLAAPRSRPFVALTFDDGYRDTLVHALPVLERHGAPFTVFATTGFADRSARLWWVELEAAVARAEAVRLTLAGEALRLPTRTPAEKERAFDRLARRLRALPPAGVAGALASLGCAPEAGRALVDALCLPWADIVQLADHPLAAIGSHTLGHPNLATLAAEDLHRELTASRAELARRLRRPVPFLAYPYGGPMAAGAREVRAAAAAGYAAAVTTRPGVLRAAHAAQPTALPRLSVNGLWPDVATLEVLLSGAPFLLDRVSGRASGGDRPAAPSSGSAA